MDPDYLPPIEEISNQEQPNYQGPGFNFDDLIELPQAELAEIDKKYEKRRWTRVYSLQ